MDFIRRAVIDVGTNSVKLLVADVAGRQVMPVLEESKQTRLGKGFYETQLLQPEAIARTARAVAIFADNARALKPASVRVVATSAARDAKNPDDLIASIRASTNLRTEIISGEQEAEWAFQGVTTATRFAEASLLIIDVGGGSTEFIVGRGQQQQLARSFPLGTVRLLERFPHGDPPTAAEFAAGHDWLVTFLRKEVRPQLETVWRGDSPSDPIILVGTGGTASLLARMELQQDHFDREAIEQVQLSLDRIKSLRAHLWSLPLVRRQEIPGLPHNRADVILTGIAIYESVMEAFGVQKLDISTRGLRYAAVMH
jgi:exopolyphosphatase/guanosine-5'-triphosphate,3'-diphosphate pyrophosphatase